MTEPVVPQIVSASYLDGVPVSRVPTPEIVQPEPFDTPAVAEALRLKELAKAQLEASQAEVSNNRKLARQPEVMQKLRDMLTTFEQANKDYQQVVAHEIKARKKAALEAENEVKATQHTQRLNTLADKKEVTAKAYAKVAWVNAGGKADAFESAWPAIRQEQLTKAASAPVPSLGIARRF